VQQFLSDSHLNLSTDMAIEMARGFLREMAQPTDELDNGGHGMLLDQAALSKLAGQEQPDQVASSTQGGGDDGSDRSKRRRTGPGPS